MLSRWSWFCYLGVLGCTSAVYAAEPTGVGEVIEVRRTVFRGIEPGEPYFSEVYEAINRAYFLPLSGGLRRSDIQKQLDDLYDIGFLANIEVTLEETDKPGEYILVYEFLVNPVIERIEVLGASLVPAEFIERLFRDLPKGLLHNQELDKRLALLLDWYRSRGYRFAEIVDKQVVDSTLFISLSEGKIFGVEFRFLDERGREVAGWTRPEVLFRELSLVPGRVYNEVVFQRDQQVLSGLGVFASVRPELVPYHDGERRGFILRYLLVERRNRNVNLNANLASGLDPGVTLLYRDRNFSGRLDSLSTDVSYSGGDNIAVTFNYRNPWLGWDDGSLRLGFSLSGFYGFTGINAFRGGRFFVPTQKGGDAITQRIQGTVSWPFRWRGRWLVLPEISFEKVTLLSSFTGQPVRRDIFGNPLTGSGGATDVLGFVGVRLLRDERNSDFVATSGSLIDIGFRQSLGFSGVNFGRLLVDAAYYLPTPWLRLGQRTGALALGGSLGLTYGHLPPYEAFVLGGEQTVRGYNFGDVASSRHYLLGTLEYRVPLPLNLYAAVFVDVATDLGSQASVPGNPGGVRGKPGFGLGYGVGLRFLNQRIALDYAFNDAGTPRISFSASLRF